MKLTRVRLQAAADVLPVLSDFYGDHLGFHPAAEARFAIGESELEFVQAAGSPFYHFALLVPGDRFEAALAWASERVEIIPTRAGEPVFDFSFWNALACYFEDPAGSIVELIAHGGIGELGTRGAFSPSELLGLSEIGLVGDVRALADDLAPLGIPLWDGTIDEPDGLAFVGERARTLILCPVGRGWLPIQRLAEPHPVHVELGGVCAGRVRAGAHAITGLG